jgi:hypothetical protein
LRDIRIQTLFLALFFGGLVSAGTEGQQSPPSLDSFDLNLPQPEWVKLYGPGQGITEPILLQPTNSFQTDCRGTKLDGKVKFSFIIDSGGLPRNVVFEQALANEIDLLALKVMLESKFQPAMFNGNPVAVGGNLEMHIHTCAEQTADQSGKTQWTFRLRSTPEEKFEGWHHPPAQANLAPLAISPDVHADHLSSDLIPPKMLVRPPPPDAKGHSGKFSFQIFVDEHGVPQDLKVLTSTDSTLLPQVALCMRNMRFKPALKNGMPVPAHLTEELDITATE